MLFFFLSDDDELSCFVAVIFGFFSFLCSSLLHRRQRAIERLDVPRPRPCRDLRSPEHVVEHRQGRAQGVGDLGRSGRGLARCGVRASRRRPGRERKKGKACSRFFRSRSALAKEKEVNERVFGRNNGVEHRDIPLSCQSVFEVPNKKPPAGTSTCFASLRVQKMLQCSRPTVSRRERKKRNERVCRHAHFVGAKALRP